MSPVEARSEALFREHMAALHAQTDRMFAALMGAQWAFGLLLAFVVSPHPWAGKVQSIHVHVPAALLLGAAISSAPVALALGRPGAPLTRHVIAIGQMLWSALLIHLTGGRIETHFHVFGSLAFLAFYRDPWVLLPATLVVAADHFLRGLFWPESVYGILDAGRWRFLEHAGWVAFEDAFLVLSIQRSLREMRALARRQASLEDVNAEIEAQVQERTRELQEAQGRLAQLALRSTPPERANLGRVIEEALELQARGLQAQGIEVVTKFEKLPALALESPRVLQILLNLFSNARQSVLGAERGDKRIAVRLWKSAPNRVRVEIEDNGTGIPVEHLSHVFEPGFSTKPDALGLGLHFSALAASELGGSLRAYSDGTGRGATFTLELPYLPAEAPA